jgi:hypothetical protein
MSGSIPPLSVDQASQIAKNTPGLAANTEPGFANTYGPGTHLPGGLLESAIPAAGIGALGLLLFYRRHLQDQQAKQKRQNKQASLADLQAQLPGIHAKDMLLGGALGGGAGLLYDLAKGAPEGKRLSKALKRVLGGAAIGAVGANVLGDRFRRYHSNVMIPAGYDAGQKARQLVPKSMQQFVDAAIKDKPAFDPKDLAEFQSRYYDKEIANTVLGARRELNRIAQGVHSKNPITDYWQKNTNGKNAPYYSVNEQNPNYSGNVDRLFGPQINSTFEALRKNPDEIIATENQNIDPRYSGAWQHSGLFGADTLLGGQQVIATRDGKNIVGRVLDRYDMTPSKAELQEAGKAVTGLQILNPWWWAKQREKAPGDYNKDDTTNAGFMANLLSRLAWDKVLTEEHPWVSQNFKITPGQEASWFPWRKAELPQLQLNTEAGK